MMRPARALPLVCALALLLATAGLALADDPAGAPASSPAAPAASVEPEETPAATDGAAVPAPAWALDAELQASRDEYRARLDELTARFRAAATPEEALAVQREIATLKVDAEIALLEVQAMRARAAGNAALAQELESAVAQVRAASAPAAPSAPAPSAPAANSDAPTPPPASGR